MAGWQLARVWNKSNPQRRRLIDPVTVEYSLGNDRIDAAAWWICKDLIEAEETVIKQSIQVRIEKEVAENRLTLQKVGLSAETLAETLHFAPFGITVSVSNQDNLAFVKNLMSVFKASTLPL